MYKWSLLDQIEHILYLMIMEKTVVYLNFTDVNLGLTVASFRLPISTAPL